MHEQAARLGVIRSEVWQRFGSGLRDKTIRDAWICEGRQFNLADFWQKV